MAVTPIREHLINGSRLHSGQDPTLVAQINETRHKVNGVQRVVHMRRNPNRRQRAWWKAVPQTKLRGASIRVSPPTLKWTGNANLDLTHPTVKRIFIGIPTGGAVDIAWRKKGRRAVRVEGRGSFHKGDRQETWHSERPDFGMKIIYPAFPDSISAPNSCAHRPELSSNKRRPRLKVALERWRTAVKGRWSRAGSLGGNRLPTTATK